MIASLVSPVTSVLSHPVDHGFFSPAPNHHLIVFVISASISPSHLPPVSKPMIYIPTPAMPHAMSHRLAICLAVSQTLSRNVLFFSFSAASCFSFSDGHRIFFFNSFNHCQIPIHAHASIRTQVPVLTPLLASIFNGL